MSSHSRERRTTTTARPEINEGLDTDVLESRVKAQIVDLVLIWTLGVTAAALAIVVFKHVGAPASLVYPLAAFFLAGYLYNVLTESFWSGKTIGKRIAGVEVRSLRGELSKRQIAIRNAPALVMPGESAYAVALLSIATDDYDRRLFDKVAGTVVARSDGATNSSGST